MVQLSVELLDNVYMFSYSWNQKKKLLFIAIVVICRKFILIPIGYNTHIGLASNVKLSINYFLSQFVIYGIAL